MEKIYLLTHERSVRGSSIMNTAIIKSIIIINLPEII